MYLCSCSCSRTAGDPRGSTPPAPADPARRGRARTAPPRPSRPGRGARRRRGRTRSRRDPRARTSPRRAAAAGPGWASASSPLRRCPGHFTSTMRTTGAGTSADADVAAGLEQHLVAGVEQPLPSAGSPSFCSSGSPPVSSTSGQPQLDHPGHDVVHAHLLAAGERVRRVAPRAAQIAGRQPHEHAGPPRVRRFALDGRINLEDRQHARADDCPGPGTGLQSTRGRFLDSHRHGGLELPVTGRAPGPASSTRARPGAEPRTSTSSRLRRALRHRRGELDVLPDPDRRDDQGLGRRTPSGFEFSVKLFQKLTHPRMFLDRLTKPPKGAPADMIAAEVDAAARPGARRRRRVGRRRRRVPPRHRSAGLGGQAGRDPRAVPGVVHQHDAAGRSPRLAHRTRSATTASPSSCATRPGATTSRRRCRC